MSEESFESEARELEAKLDNEREKVKRLDRARKDLIRDQRDLLSASEVLSSYCQGFSENRTVAEAKETVERFSKQLATE